MRAAAVVVAALLLAGCAGRDLRPTPRVSSSSELCGDRSLGPDDLCLPTGRVETVLRERPVRVLQTRKPPSGIGGAQVVFLEFPDDHLRLKAKWKRATHNASGHNNDPRKELAAYAIQKLFLEPEDYVVPPTVGRCLPRELYAEEVSRRETRPNIDGTSCVFGVLAYWIPGVTVADGLSLDRFWLDDPYRDRVAILNVFTYLIDHRDTHKENFVIRKDARDPRMFAVDNGLAFSGLRNPRAYFTEVEWSRLLVPGLPRRVVDRLRQVTRAELQRLAVVAQFRIVDRQLAPVAPTAPLSGTEGVRRVGDVVQFGLTDKEIDRIAARLQALLERIDAGQIAVFDDGGHGPVARTPARGAWR